MTTLALADRVAQLLSLPPQGVASVMSLFDEGATVPFIARYRKERTGNLDEVQIRAIEENRARLLALEQRRAAIVASIEEQGKMNPALLAALTSAGTRAELEDLYLPYKRKRRTRATVARERGLLPLAERMLAQPESGDPRREAARFVDPKKEVPDVTAALAGARDIVAELVSEHPGARRVTREAFARDGVFACKAARGKKKVKSKFEQYYDFKQPIARIPSHRVLAIFRGETEGFLKARIDVDAERLARRLGTTVGRAQGTPFARELDQAVLDSLTRLLGPSVENGLRGELEQRAHREAVDVFATNLQSLLLAAPLGEAPVLGIDPGIRTGCKCAAVDATGRFLENQTIFPDRRDAAPALIGMVKKHRPRAVAVGNGTAGRETESFVRSTLKDAGIDDVLVVAVNEAGASVYSASDVAREEHPDLDLTVRGAISIARRLQDPLAELVKIDPQAIGVGQYQHDVDQKMLSAKLAQVTESCVNGVGAELNTASAALLAHVAGVGPSLAKKIVAHRTKHGRFSSRSALGKVKGLGPRAFEQCAGFLRVHGGDHPLDASAVHPERYALVERMAKDLGTSVSALARDASLAKRIDLSRYLAEDVGQATLNDILRELEKPGRDPRECFEPPKFRDDVREFDDLRDGMQLEGVVTNVTHFGAFVDVGVHQDGLVHISELADRYVTDPHAVVKVGDRLSVRVLSIDRDRRRIGLSAKRE
ncbi:MAG: RNA-binding transcriptional accessory protein [Deltaproteobacteria bacterium]|nr:MAG: RNA-binding transcriptional accessory protein [Deltaproteobacteria bacterium]